MIELAKTDLCTGCGACSFVCPKQCISIRENEIGVALPVVDATNCIDCLRCEKVCPIINPVDSRQPIKAYAAWSSNEEERRTSASGGIAIEAYKDAVEKGYACVGAVQNENFSVSLHVAESEKELVPFKNSKYVFSSATDVFAQIKILLKQNKKVLVIALPCQIAALRKIFKDNENLLLADVVCHGITPFSYLQQHISSLEKQLGEKAVRMSFRDPDTYTYTFTFTLYNIDGQRFYAKRTKHGDLYQYGYHRTISYRENCYHCHFAQSRRISDFTLSDYKGLGKMAPCKFDALNVSSILIHTLKGEIFIERLISEGKIIAEERPVQEPIAGDAQLRHPSVKSSARKDFEKLIVLHRGNFIPAISAVYKRSIQREKIADIYSFPKRLLQKIKRIIFK